jgi:hypothetical protein
MKIMIICSKYIYQKILPIKKFLETKNHKITLPNSFENPFKEEEMKDLSKKDHIKFKQKMMKLHSSTIKKNDAVLVLNLEKKGIPNYIGGATFMEIIKAWELNKKIFFFNPIPNCSFTDELTAINPIILNRDLLLIK